MTYERAQWWATKLGSLNLVAVAAPETEHYASVEVRYNTPSQSVYLDSERECWAFWRGFVEGRRRGRLGR